jgi:hypothetical protein
MAASALVALAAIGPTQAQTTAYTWTGMGTSVVDSSKCATYRLTVDITVEGKMVKGVLKQQGRPERLFETSLGDNGLFRAKADLDAGNAVDISGTISDKESRVLLDGYCKFEGKLTPK